MSKQLEARIEEVERKRQELEETIRRAKRGGKNRVGGPEPVVTVGPA
jgi:hypothetical protein